MVEEAMVVEDILYQYQHQYQHPHQYIVLGVHMEDGPVEIRLVDPEPKPEAGAVHVRMVHLELGDVEEGVPLKLNKLTNKLVEEVDMEEVDMEEVDMEEVDMVIVGMEE